MLTFLAHVGVLGPVMVRFDGGLSLAASDDAGLVAYMKQAAGEAALHVQGLKLDHDEFVTKLLDNGCHVAYFEQSDDENLQLQVLKSFPKARVGVDCSGSAGAVTVASMVDVVGRYGGVAGHFLFRMPSMDGPGLQDMAAIRQQAKVVAATGVHVSFLLPPGSTEADLAMLSTFHENVNAVFYPKIVTTLADKPVIRSPFPPSAAVLAEAAAANVSADTLELDVVGAFIACLRTDRPDGLYTTVVCDEHDVCLGLVYSNEQSIRTALSERKGVYWSRSRGGLWRKGDSSGMHQTLLSVKFDCDGDAMRFSVVQHGEPPAFCHLMTKTCWGPVHGLHHLEEVLIDRRKSAPAGSYTKRLFDDPDLLQKKLLEEVQELIEATEPDHVAAEAADVIYFMMTRCVAAGVGLRDIERHLDKRTLKVTRRPGNAKAWRSENAANILQGKAPVADPTATAAST